MLQFGTGMLLRAIVADAVDRANRADQFGGSIVVVQSTPRGLAAAINAQHGAFDLVEQGLEHGEPVQRRHEVAAISRALLVSPDWEELLALVAKPALRVIVSNVTEAGFRIDEEWPDASFPARIADLLHARFLSLADGPLLFVIPTELVPDNGARLAEMVDSRARLAADAAEFRAWIAQRVRFCSSLVDRITTGAPSDAAGDVLVTVTEPSSLWAIECDPGEMREAFPIDLASEGRVVLAPDISFYRERKLRILNGTHTAMAPMALMAGVRLVRDAVTHDKLGPFMRRILFDEIAPSTSLEPTESASYAQQVLDRFANPWLEHEWRVIATNQTAKLRLRVVPSIIEFADKFKRSPEGLIWAFAASLRYARAIRRVNDGEAEGWWRGASYPIVDVDFDLIDWHWRSVDATPTALAISQMTLSRFAKSVLGDAAIWGCDLTAIPGMSDGVIGALVGMET